MAQAFDAGKLQLSGEPFPVVEQVGFNSANGRGFFTVSENGVLAYRDFVFADTQLAWVDRTGKQIARIGTAAQITGLALSPDEKRVVVPRFDSQTGTSDLWLIDQARETRFTFDPASDTYPVWSPDGNRIAFGSGRSGSTDLYLKPSSGAGNEELLLKSSNSKAPHDWSLDGRYLLYGEIDPKTNFDLWVLPLFGDRKPIPFLQTTFNETNGRFSPDGRWIAYVSNETGPFQVYVQSFPQSGGKWMVSTNGGTQPRWRPDGKELFYLGADRKLMVVDVKEDANKFEAGSPRALFEMRIFVGFGSTPGYEVTRDGQRFLVNTPGEESLAAPLIVVLNWTAGLKR
jgi:Tol biopolymer transport system component